MILNSFKSVYLVLSVSTVYNAEDRLRPVFVGLIIYKL